ncbi:hypothetical protein AAF712_008928 [Marasmius tenuissimus]|uniref:Uncharacterized protein n=1 Tax=Marasmius tenuissimus TaxID=585030 RepID=A0ABR2ZR97_9AGAR
MRDSNAVPPESTPSKPEGSGIGLFVALIILYMIYVVAQPDGTRYWDEITPSRNCTSIGTRTYTAILTEPNGTRANASGCSDVSVTIHGRILRHPASCSYEESSNGTQGIWFIDFDEPGCIPSWDPLPKPRPDSECLTLTRSSTGKRRYTTYMTLSRVPPGLNPMHVCLNTPLFDGHRRSYVPDECNLVKGVSPPQTGAGIGDVLEARFTVDDGTCPPVGVEAEILVGKGGV